KRHNLNPLITPKDVKPSRDDFEVIGTFNAGATTYQDEVILLVRVAERPRATHPRYVYCPHMANPGEIVIEAIAKDDTRYDTSDPRTVKNRQTGELLLTSISHIRLARSQDGVHFVVDDKPWLGASTLYESYGIEDARVTFIDRTYYVNYSAVSSN